MTNPEFDQLGGALPKGQGERMAAERDREGFTAPYTCEHCGVGIHFARMTFCVACLNRLPDEIRGPLWTEFRYGQERGKVAPSEAWEDAHRQAVTILKQVDPRPEDPDVAR